MDNSGLAVLILSSGADYCTTLATKLDEEHLLVRLCTVESLSREAGIGQGYDAVIGDMALGLDAWRAWLAHDEAPPLVVVSDSAREDEARRLLHLGAADLLTGENLIEGDLRYRLECVVERHAGCGLTLCQRPNEMRRLELMQTVFAIISRKDLTLRQQISEILRAGCRLFGQDVGMVSRIEGETYTVEHVYCQNLDIRPGQTFSLADTFCSLTVAADHPVGIEALSCSEWAGHPCEEHGLEAYIGVPLRVDQEIYGTLCFASPEPRTLPFEATDLEFIQTLADWVSVVLAQARRLDELHLLANYDSLTQLPKRNTFLERLERCCGRAEHSPAYVFALLFIDLDRFKPINDERGHLAGDQVLREVGRRLESLIRPQDMVARFGGDEFVVLLESDDRQVAESVATRVRESMSSPFSLEDGSTVQIGASVGIAMSTASGEARRLLHLADEAMYAAKRQGLGVVFAADN